MNNLGPQEEQRHMREKLIGSLLSLVLVSTVSAQAHAAEVQRVSFAGTGATVQFFGSAAITCGNGSPGFVGAFGSLLGAEQVSRMTGVPTVISNGLFVQIDSYSNSCTGQVIGSSNGFIENAFQPLDKKLTSTVMVGSVVVQDFNTGEQISVSVDVDVIGDGQLSQSKGNSKSSVRGSKGGPITVTQTRSANSNRTGFAQGTITIDGVTIVPDFFSFLFGTSNATHTISK
jgi:hypothetical protein